MINNSNMNGAGHNLALKSLARRNRDRWIQEGKEGTKIITESTLSITFPFMVHSTAIIN